MAECNCVWLDSARVTRMAWPQFAKSGYGLSNVAAYFGIEYQAHDVLEDADAPACERFVQSRKQD